MIPPLISFSLAKKHLRITSNDHDTEIDIKRRLASSIAANHCKLTSVPDEWISTEEPMLPEESDDIVLTVNSGSPAGLQFIRVPADIQAAILLMLSDLFDNGDASTSDILSETVINLLRPHRDPTMA